MPGSIPLIKNQKYGNSDLNIVYLLCCYCYDYYKVILAFINTINMKLTIKSWLLDYTSRQPKHGVNIVEIKNCLGIQPLMTYKKLLCEMAVVKTTNIHTSFLGVKFSIAC